MKPALTKEEWVSGRHDEPGLIKRGAWHEGTLNVEFERTRDQFVGHVASGLGIRCGGKGGPMAMLEPEDQHALAAICLYRQPFGFTREDVQLLRDLADGYAQEACASDLRADAGEQLGDSGLWGINARACGKRAESCASLADRIEALLPPEEETP